MRKLNVWVEKIQEFFSNSGIEELSLGWDRHRFFNIFSDTFKGYSTTNNTDFNYSYCNSFDLKIPSSMIIGNYIITLKLSFVLNAFVLFVTSYSPNFQKGKVISIADVHELNEIYQEVLMFAKSLNFEEVDDEWLDIKVPNVQLELAEIPTLDNCLFDDFEDNG